MSSTMSDRAQDLLARAGLERLPPRARVGVACAVALVLAVAVWRFWPAAPAPEVSFDEVAEAGAAETEADGSEEPTEPVPASAVVHVAGAVLRPGVYSLPVGARVSDAVASAGGALGSAAADAVNLARIVADGERIYIPTQEETDGFAAAVGAAEPWSGEPAAPGTASAGGTIDVNRATAAELEELPGVGPATAQKIIDDREANGPFAKPEDLMRVPGIGAKKFEAMREQVSVG